MWLQTVEKAYSAPQTPTAGFRDGRVGPRRGRERGEKEGTGGKGKGKDGREGGNGRATPQIVATSSP